MDFDFLPNIPPPPKPNTSEGTGGKFNVGKNVFFDDYLHHLDAHKLFSTPPLRNEFDLIGNFAVAKNIFSKSTIEYKIQSNFFGYGTTFQNLIDGYTEFQDPNLLNETINKIDNEIPADLFSGIEKPKMKINDRFGVFSFDLASMQMTYVYEYFDKKGNKVDANFVKKIGTNFYFENEIVEQRIKRHENGNPVVVSSVRNCLIDFEKQPKKQRAVEIFVINSASASVLPKDFIYNSMAAISVAKNLILKGFQVKITALLSVTNNNTFYYHFIPTKRFNQPLDINATAYVCGDTRFFRYQGFKIYLKGYDRNNKISPDGLGYPFTVKKTISETIEKEYVKNSKLKQADTRLYFGNSRNLEDVKKEVKEALLILNEKYGNSKN